MSDRYTGRDAGMPNPPVGRHQAHIWEESDAPSRSVRFAICKYDQIFVSETSNQHASL